jgi:uncharacterized protein YegJ (DUF2314 family)
MYTLLNGIEQHLKHPDTFEIPTELDITFLEVEDYVKLCFEEEGRASERMWVTITKIDEDNFTGTLDNEPFELKSVKLGDTINFKAKNIIGILSR